MGESLFEPFRDSGVLHCGAVTVSWRFSQRDWIIRLWRTSCEIRVTLVGVFSIAYLVQARSSGMQFMNVTLFKQSSLSNTAKHIASNHKMNPGKNLAAQSREPKSLNHMWGWVRNLRCRIYVNQRAMICFVLATWQTWLFGARYFLYYATTFRVTIVNLTINTMA